MAPIPRGAIVGFGTIAVGHLAGYGDSARLSVTAVVDPCAARRAVAQRLGLAAYPDVESLFARVRPDFLDICSPPSSHAEYLLEAIDREVPVICEKPVFVPSSGGYGKLFERILAASTVVYPCQNYKYAPVFAMVRATLEEGVIGDVLGVKIAVLRSGHASGVTDWRPDWRRDSAVSAGGILRDHGPHAVYLATSLTGLVPQSVFCIAQRMRGEQAWDSEDTALVRIRCAGGAEIELTLTWSASSRDSRYTFLGSRGMVVVDNDELSVIVHDRTWRRRHGSNFDDPLHRHWFGAMFTDFHDVIRDPIAHAGRIRDLLLESMMTSMVIDAGYASAALAGRWMAVAEPVASVGTGRAT